jgi:hypothetical protein
LSNFIGSGSAANGTANVAGILYHCLGKQTAAWKTTAAAVYPRQNAFNPFNLGVNLYGKFPGGKTKQSAENKRKAADAYNLYYKTAVNHVLPIFL